MQTDSPPGRTPWTYPGYGYKRSIPPPSIVSPDQASTSPASCTLPRHHINPNIQPVNESLTLHPHPPDLRDHPQNLLETRLPPRQIPPRRTHTEPRRSVLLRFPSCLEHGLDVDEAGGFGRRLVGGGLRAVFAVFAAPAGFAPSV